MKIRFRRSLNQKQNSHIRSRCIIGSDKSEAKDNQNLASIGRRFYQKKLLKFRVTTSPDKGKRKAEERVLAERHGQLATTHSKFAMSN